MSFVPLIPSTLMPIEKEEESNLISSLTMQSRREGLDRLKSLADLQLTLIEQRRNELIKEFKNNEDAILLINTSIDFAKEWFMTARFKCETECSTYMKVYEQAFTSIQKDFELAAVSINALEGAVLRYKETTHIQKDSDAQALRDDVTRTT